jgi:hypothetical protein
MVGKHGGASFLKELREFLAFLRSLWGLLTGFSVFFPLSNVFLRLIPMGRIHDDPPGALGYLSAGLVTSVATLTVLFVVFSTFGNRDVARQAASRRLVLRSARRSFGLGLAALVGYLCIYYGIYPTFYEPVGISAGDAGWLIGDFGLMFFYAAFFSWITRAFVLLGIMEYDGGTSTPPKPPSPKG